MDNKQAISQLEQLRQQLDSAKLTLDTIEKTVKGTPNQNHSPESLLKYQKLAQELTKTLSEMDMDDAQHTQKLQKKLSGNINVEILLDSYQIMLNLLLGNAAKEKATSQKFLLSLNTVLNTVRQEITSTLTQSEQETQLKNQLNSDIHEQMERMGESIQNCSELNELKNQVTEQLNVIRKAFDCKESQDKKQQARLQKSLDSMREEMYELSLQTSNYKSKLSEQQELTQQDSLTKVPNRAALEAKLQQVFYDFQQQHTPFWLAIVDIDFFKSINDNFGHSTGDKTLQVIAKALKNALRDTEFVARYGGDEFVLIIPTVSANDITHLLNRVREKIKSIPFKFKNHEITVTVSIGAAQISNHKSIQDTFDNADAALYRAKNTSRDLVVVDNG